MSEPMSEVNNPLLTRAGISVNEDPDQNFAFQWSRQVNGRTVEGCEVSFQTLEEAEEDALVYLADHIEDELGLSVGSWDAATDEQKQAWVDEVFA